MYNILGFEGKVAYKSTGDKDLGLSCEIHIGSSGMLIVKIHVIWFVNIRVMKYYMQYM